MRFHASRGDPAFNTLWEALAILVGLRAWKTADRRFARVAIRSDNLGALCSLSKMAAKSPELNVILREISLDESDLSQPLLLLRHIPGVANVIADSLSRLHAPSPKVIPSALSHLHPTPLPRRDRRYWQASRPPALPKRTFAPRP